MNKPCDQCQASQNLDQGSLETHCGNDELGIYELKRAVLPMRSVDELQVIARNSMTGDWLIYVYDSTTTL